MIVCGDAGEALGDSLYEGRIYVRGRVESLGSDAVRSILSRPIWHFSRMLSKMPDGRIPDRFQEDRLSGKRLYNFARKKEIWKNAL